MSRYQEGQEEEVRTHFRTNQNLKEGRFPRTGGMLSPKNQQEVDQVTGLENATVEEGVCAAVPTEVEDFHSKVLTSS